MAEGFEALAELHDVAGARNVLVFVMDYNGNLVMYSGGPLNERQVKPHAIHLNRESHVLRFDGSSFIDLNTAGHLETLSLAELESNPWWHGKIGVVEGPSRALLADFDGHLKIAILWRA